MKLRFLLVAIVFLIGVFAIFAVGVRRGGSSARSAPPIWEAFAAEHIRGWSIPSDAKRLTNPVAGTAEMLKRGREHWADHCANCHANNGSGETEMGRNLYPRVPDMRGEKTQSLSDGELYYIIRNGVPMTGMPAWGDVKLGNNDMETWMLVSFIRHLPSLAADEQSAMEKLNPKSEMEREEEQEESDFLSGKTTKEKTHEH